MKSICQQDIQALRERLIREHDKLLEEYKLVQGCSPSQWLEDEEKGRKLQQLEAVTEEMERITGQSADVLLQQQDRIRELYREINELRVYFGAPTGRPLEDHGVSFVAPYIQTMRLLFQMEQSMILYVEMIRTDLALLEYQLEHQQNIGPCLDSLLDSIELFRYADRFTNTDDIRHLDLTTYLLEIQELLAPFLYDGPPNISRQTVSRVVLSIAMALKEFACMPEEPDEELLNSLIVSMLLQLMEEPDLYTAFCCQEVAMMLWDCPLPEEKKAHVAICYNKAQEVLEGA